MALHDGRGQTHERAAAGPTYVGSYYHLGKLLERAGDFEKAIRIYKRGMEEAKRAGDNHSYGELQGALEDIEEG